MKKIFLMLLVAATIVSCNKQEIKPNNAQEVESINYGSNAKAAADWGEVIADTTADNMKDRFEVVSEGWDLTKYLNETYYDSIMSQTGADAFVIAYANVGDQIYYAMDDREEPIIGVFFKGTSTGGVAISALDAGQAIIDFDNSTADHPTHIAYGKSIVDSIYNQSGVVKLSISNAYLQDGEDDGADYVLQGLNSSNTDTGFPVSKGGKGCGHWEIHGSPTPQLHWVPCGWVLQAVWNVFTGIPE